MQVPQKMSVCMCGGGGGGGGGGDVNGDPLVSDLIQ